MAAVQFDWASTAPINGLVLLAAKDGVVVERMVLPVKPVIVLGRNGTLSDLVFDHPSLSRQHAAVAAGQDGQLYLVDLKSTHGTLCEGKKLASQERVPLRVGASEADAAATKFSLGASSRQLFLVQTAAPSSSSSGRTSGATGSLNEGSDEDDAPRLPPRPAAHSTEEEASFASRLVFAPPPPRKPVLAVGPAPAAPLPPQETDAEHRARARAEREAEIAAAIESMKAPASFAGAGPSRREAEEDDSCEDDGDNGSGQAVDEDAALAAAMGLPVSFGAASSSSPGKSAASGGGSTVAGTKRAASSEEALEAYAKRRKLEDGSAELAVGEDDGSEGTGQHAGPASAEAAAAALGLPVSHEAALASHSKAVTALAFDHAGARLLTGGADHLLKFFDFAGMDASLLPFREVTPTEGQSVLSLAFSPNGDRLLVGTGGVKPRVFSRDGQPLLTFIRGDQYIVDIANTKGHVAAVTAVAWHPVNPSLVLTAALDSSVRLWDLGGKTVFNELQCRDVIKLKNAQGQRTGVTAAAFAPDGASFAAATEDGGLAIFALKPAGHKYLRPDAAKPGAHAAGETTCIVYSPDGTRFATRSAADNTVKVWDAKGLGRGATGGCLLVIRGVDTLHASSNVAWSPDGRLLLAGTTVRKGGSEPGRLLAFDVAAAAASAAAATAAPTLSPDDAVYSLTLAPGVSSVCVAWQAGINQLAIGCSDGSVRVMFRPGVSQRGALLCLTKEAAKRRDISDSIPLSQGSIIAVNALPMYRDEVPRGAFIPGRPKPRWQELVKAKEEQAKARHVPASLPEGVQPEYVYKGVKPVVKAYAEANADPGAPNLRAQDPAEVLRAYAASDKFRAESVRLKAALNPGGAQTVLAARTLEDEMEKQGDELRALLKDNIAGRS